MDTRTPSGDPDAAFVIVGGRPCLDLADTLGKRGTRDIERLSDPARLGRWLHEVGLADAPVPVDEDELQRAHELREAVYLLVRSVLDDAEPDGQAVALVNHMAAGADLAPRLVASPPRGAAVLNARWHGPAPVDAALSTLARDAIDLLAGPLAPRVKECENPDCTLVFLDDSQARRRRWCAMERCGNLAKIAKYRSRDQVRTSEPSSRSTSRRG